MSDLKVVRFVRFRFGFGCDVIGVAAVVVGMGMVGDREVPGADFSLAFGREVGAGVGLGL